MVMDQRPGSTVKAVYLAPTKALCNEKSASWTKKFRSLNLKCVELTGDTTEANYVVLSQADVMQVQLYKLRVSF